MDMPLQRIARGYDVLSFSTKSSQPLWLVCLGFEITQGDVGSLACIGTMWMGSRQSQGAAPFHFPQPDGPP
jgi:hypothetical protein